MSPVLIEGCTELSSTTRITFDEFHVIWHANTEAYDGVESSGSLGLPQRDARPGSVRNS